MGVLDMQKNSFYVTSPIYYVNAKPHLGTLYSTLICDALARWNKVLGSEVFFLTGTDEHGQKIQEKAVLENMEPQAFVDSMIPAFKQVWELFNLSYDKFIRTTDVDHEHAVVSWIKQLQEQGDIYKAVYTGWYCVPCETFINIGSECIKNERQEYVCNNCKRPLKELEEESYFFKLSAFQDRLLAFYAANPNFITPRERMNEVLSFVKSGLKDLSISRKTVSWGIPFPGDASHTVYVWGDALNNYISAIGYGGDAAAMEQFNHWWPANVHVMAKDIVRFHAVYWPAFLMAAGLALPKKLLVHGYILTDSQKMSKSLGNAVDPVDLATTYGVDQVRYYLLKQMAINQDGNFSLGELEDIVNADLANNLGNLLNRSVTLALKNELAIVKSPELWDGKAAELRDKCGELYVHYAEALENGMFHVALADVCKFLSEVNAYFHASQPWILVKSDRVAFATTIAATCNALHHVALLLWPIMPKKMVELLKALGIEFNPTLGYKELLHLCAWQQTFTLPVPEGTLFSRIEKIVPVLQPVEPVKQSTKESAMTPITIDEFAKVELLVGTILTCQPVTGSNKLYRLEVDFGHVGQRQILSGVAQSFTCEELVNKQAIFVTNLQPRAMMGLESHGMLLMAKDAQGLTLATVAKGVTNGTRLS